MSLKKRKVLYKWSFLIWVSSFNALGVISILAIIISFNPGLPDPLPDYPNAAKLTSNGTLPNELLSSACCSEEYFGGQQFQVFVSADNPEQIMSFYQEKAQKREYSFVKKESNAIYFSKESTALMFSSKVPVLAVRVLSWVNPQDVPFISQYFPLTPPKTNVILLIQGFKSRTLS